MKLSPIQVEAALTQASTAVSEGPGKIELTLRRALERLGEHGVNWIQGEQERILRAAFVRFPIIEPINPRYNPLEIPCNTMRYEEMILPDRIGYCSVGAIVGFNGMPAPDTCDIFKEANPHILNIVGWNDHEGTHWSHVQSAFERAIRYAADRKL